MVELARRGRMWTSKFWHDCLGLRYCASTLSKQNCDLITGTGQPDTGSNGCSPAIIGTLSWSANLSGVK